MTIDTECHDFDSVNRYIWGKTSSGERFGIDKILSLAKELRIPVNFFVDIPEAVRYGKEYVQSIVTIIHDAGQKAYIHLHPNYISGENEQTFFWKYSVKEKATILKQTKELAESFLSKEEMRVFRIGRYGADAEMYDVLKRVLGREVIDFSYCYENDKMCHLTESEVGTKNKVILYKDCLLFPNTRYIGFCFGGITKTFNLDAFETSLGEFKTIIDSNELDNITITMHSWSFIKSFFFVKNKVWGDSASVEKFRAMVQYAKSKGYVFSDISESRTCILPSNKDQIINLCVSPLGKIKALLTNFLRFQNIARLSRKYFFIYSVFYVLLLAILVCVVLMIAL